LNLNMTRYCMVNDINGFPRLSPLNTYLQFPNNVGDKIMNPTTATVSNANYLQLPAIHYGFPPCIVAFNNYFYGSIDVCEIATSYGYFYAKCEDPVAFAAALNAPNPKTTFIGYFLGSMPNDGQLYSAFSSAACGSVNKFIYPAVYFENGLSYANQNGGTVIDGNVQYYNVLKSTCYYGNAPGWGVWPIYGLNDFPTVVYQGNTMLLNALSTITGNSFVVNNCASAVSLSYMVSDTMQTQVSQQTSINKQTSSQTAYSQSLTLSYQFSTGAGSFANSQSTVTTNFGFTQTESSQVTVGSQSTTQVTDTIVSQGTFNINPHSKVLITEVLTQSTLSIQHNILVNSQLNSVIQDTVSILPAGFTTQDLGC